MRVMRDRLVSAGQGRTDDTLGSGAYGARGPQTTAKPGRRRDRHRSDKPINNKRDFAVDASTAKSRLRRVNRVKQKGQKMLFGS